ncbi:MAG: TrkA family potassium uptake protein [Chitinophagales bacterium]|nr:TrkA family potassium uptake protein [Bacteroidota bacterium]MCB9225733.1 TrkA family potassium uptake protein [Chitinophagales bacterium]
MKYIIVGLGNFGASLAQELTEMGHEVIGIDSRMAKVDTYKEKISHTICMDATDEFTMAGLPINDTDVFIVAIGEDQGANIMASAILKNFKVKRLISRAINNLHEKVLHAIGVDEIVHPEQETAERWAKKLNLRNVVDSFELSDNFSIIETEVPLNFVGKTLAEVDFRKNFNILLLTTIKKEEVKSLIGKTRLETKVQGVAQNNIAFEEKDILVLYGNNKDLERFLKKKSED